MPSRSIRNSPTDWFQVCFPSSLSVSVGLKPSIRSMSNEGGVNSNGHLGRMISIVEPRVVQGRADDGKRLNPERPKAIAGPAKSRDRASTERTIEPAVQAKE